MAEMTQAQFAAVAELLRSREPVKTAVRMVLVKGVLTKEAAEATGLVPQSVSNACSCAPNFDHLCAFKIDQAEMPIPAGIGCG